MLQAILGVKTYYLFLEKNPKKTQNMHQQKFTT